MDAHNNKPLVAPQSSEDMIERTRIDQKRRWEWRQIAMFGMVIAALVLLILTAIFVSKTTVLSGNLSALEEDISQLEAANTRLSTEIQQLEEEIDTYSFFFDPASEGFFDDALFIGDSVSYKLELYAESQRAAGYNCLDNAQFFTATSMGWANSLNEIGSIYAIHASYHGEEMMLEDAVAASGAKKVYIMLGINDIASYGVDAVIDNVDTSCQHILEKNPDTVLYLESVTPIVDGNQKESLNNSMVAEFNEILLEYCQENGFYYLDVASVVSDENGNLREDYCSDIEAQGIHFTNEACEVWIDYLQEHPYGL